MGLRIRELGGVGAFLLAVVEVLPALVAETVVAGAPRQTGSSTCLGCCMVVMVMVVGPFTEGYSGL